MCLRDATREETRPNLTRTATRGWRCVPVPRATAPTPLDYRAPRLRALARNAGTLTRRALPGNALVIPGGDNDWRCRDLQWLPRPHAINTAGPRYSLARRRRGARRRAARWSFRGLIAPEKFTTVASAPRTQSARHLGRSKQPRALPWLRRTGGFGDSCSVALMVAPRLMYESRSKRNVGVSAKTLFVSQTWICFTSNLDNCT